MGYLTRYSVVLVDVPHEQAVTIVGEFRASDADADYCLNAAGGAADAGKWYSHEDDFRALSKKHPGILFKVTGEGDDNEDLWHKYFRDGKMQVCKAVITYPPFNEEKLK